jgi:hypothetical protein
MNPLPNLPVADQVAKLAALLGDDPPAAIDRTFRPMVSALIVCSLTDGERRRLGLLREGPHPRETADRRPWFGH